MPEHDDSSFFLVDVVVVIVGGLIDETWREAQRKEIMV